MMMKLAVSLALLLPLLAAPLSYAEEFDFFYLVQQWPGSYCDTQRGCCYPQTGKPAAAFGIHGLWPNYAKCKSGGDDDGVLDMVVQWRQKCWPEYCDGNPLSMSAIQDLVEQLDRSWPTLACKGGESMQFWSHEWRRHGTCSGLSQHAYFAAALAIRAQHDLAAILAAAGVAPSADQTYDVSSITDAINAGTGSKANIECNRDANGESQLYQVFQCVDRAGKNLIDCPLHMESKCSDRVKLPSF